MDEMEIQGMSMSSTVLANANLQSGGIGLMMMNKALDADQANGQMLASMLERSVNPMVGQNIDIRV